MQIFRCALPAFFGVLATVVAGQGQTTVTEKQDARVAIVGMEAFREVLETGRYVVGPGDQFVLLIPGVEEALELWVTAEGSLLIPRVGRVPVGGLRLSSARAAILDACRTQLPSVEISVELGQFRTFPVSVAGMVGVPGVSIASGVQRIGQVIRNSGGILDGASKRNIRLIRGGQLRGRDRQRIETYLQTNQLPHSDSLEVLRVDLELYYTTGLTRYNPFVEDGDLIVVPAKGEGILARENWSRPGTYEYAPGDRISDLVSLALGPAVDYDPENVLLFRYANGRWRYLQHVDLAAAVARDPEADLLLQPADWLIARKLPDYQNRSTVRVIGEVVYPGSYVVDLEGSRLKEVLEQAGGLTERASLGKSRVVRDFDAEQVNDPEWTRIMAIPAASWDREEKQYFNMKSREKPGRMVVDFIELFATEDGGAGQNILVRPGDAIFVPMALETVLVSGQAANPGSVPFDESYTVADYIERAGGFSWRASSDVVIIQARTGVWRDADDVDKLEPGDRIWIKENPVHDRWALFLEGMQVAGQVATVVLLFVTILK